MDHVLWLLWIAGSLVGCLPGWNYLPRAPYDSVCSIGRDHVYRVFFVLLGSFPPGMWHDTTHRRACDVATVTTPCPSSGRTRTRCCSRHLLPRLGDDGPAGFRRVNPHTRREKRPRITYPHSLPVCGNPMTTTPSHVRPPLNSRRAGERSTADPLEESGYTTDQAGTPTPDSGLARVSG